MKLIRRRELKNAVLSHIAKPIRGEMQDWDNVEVWMPFTFADDYERDIAADMFEMEAKRLCNRIN